MPLNLQRLPQTHRRTVTSRSSPSRANAAVDAASDREALSPAEEAKARRGIAHFKAALGYSLAGWRHGIEHEEAIRQELVVVGLLSLVSLWLPLGRLEHLVLVLSMLLVLVVELLNSALEATVDRVSLVHHPLAGRAKDLGSAAVFTTIGMSTLTWVVLVGPMAWQWVTSLTR